MRQAYAILGLLFIIIIAGTFVLYRTPKVEVQIEKEMENDIMKELTMLTLTSSAFENNSTIPSRYTCDSDNINPPLFIAGVPEGAKSLVLLMDDPDIPQVFKTERGIDSFDHWTVFNIQPEITEIQEGHTPPGVEGANGRGEHSYTGPCPPPQYEPTEHRYVFKLFALDRTLDLPEGATKVEVLEAMKGYILEQAELVGLYDRANK